MAFPSQSFSYNYIFPSGTALLFQQSSAPPGWTKIVTNNDCALRITSGSVTTGGSVAFSSAFTSQAVTGTNAGYTLAIADIPAHNHGINDPGHSHSIGDPGHAHYYTVPATNVPGGTYVTVPGGYWYNGWANYTNGSGTGVYVNGAGTGISTQNQGGGGSHTHTFSGNAINLAVKYVDAIICTKN